MPAAPVRRASLPLMAALPLILVLLGAIILRLLFILLHWTDLGRLWDDLDRRGIRFQLARALDLMTFLAFAGFAFYALWDLRGQTGFWQRYGTAFVAWFGVSLLPRLPVHRFPRTNLPRSFSEAQILLIAHLITAVISGLGMTGLTALYFWMRN